MADELIEIADNPETEAASVNRDWLKVDTRKWLLSKALPKLYGDRLTAEMSGPDSGPIKTQEMSPLELARRIAFIFEKGRRKLAKQREAEQAG